MSYKILCPFHEEMTPSCVVYDTHYYCFSCNARGPLSAIGKKVKAVKADTNPPSDIAADIRRIKALPKDRIRGLDLHCDNNGYYVLWPNDAYYKYRTTQGQSKYLSPRGHKKPPYWANRASNRTLAIVEGELNAISLALADLPIDVVSPGSATDFENYLPEQGYNDYIIVVDSDAAGVQAAIKSKSKLLAFTPNVSVILMSGQDVNDILVETGGTYEEFKAKMASVLKLSV